MSQKSDNHENIKSRRLQRKPAHTFYLPYLQDIVTMIAGVILIFSLLFRVIVVSGDSMKNTLLDGDWILLLGNTCYTEPKRGDIIVASKDSFDDGTPIIKRVIATQGDVVDIDFETGAVSVNGNILDEPYIHSPTTTKRGVTFPLTVDDGCIFVMGDNRAVSLDSRSSDIGLIDCREVLGKAMFIVVPGTDDGKMERDIHRIGMVS